MYFVGVLFAIFTAVNTFPQWESDYPYPVMNPTTPAPAPEGQTLVKLDGQIVPISAPGGVPLNLTPPSGTTYPVSPALICRVIWEGPIDETVPLPAAVRENLPNGM
ncbi:hypothetical protein V3C99_010210 [Haemonchus contortus]